MSFVRSILIAAGAGVQIGGDISTDRTSESAGISRISK